MKKLVVDKDVFDKTYETAGDSVPILREIELPYRHESFDEL
ncbi:hypothetical protein [Gottfriedia acidiceleris]